MVKRGRVTAKEEDYDNSKTMIKKINVRSHFGKMGKRVKTLTGKKERKKESPRQEDRKKKGRLIIQIC